jgi:hypothetical protein
LIPYFIGQFEPGLASIVDFEWKVIQPATIASTRIVGVSVSAWDSKLDVDGKSREVVMGLLRELI